MPFWMNESLFFVTVGWIVAALTFGFTVWAGVAHYQGYQYAKKQDARRKVLARLLKAQAAAWPGRDVYQCQTCKQITPWYAASTHNCERKHINGHGSAA